MSRSRAPLRRAALGLLFAVAGGLAFGCDLTWDDGSDHPAPALLLYAAPQGVDPTGQTLTLVGAKARHDGAGALCLRLTAERGTLALPGGAAEAVAQPPRGAGGDATDGGGGADAAAPPLACTAPRCLFLRMPDDQSMPVYAVYRSEGADRNDLVLGSLYRSTCPPQAGAAPLAVGQVELGTTPVPFSPAPAPADAGADAPPVAGGDGAAADIVGAADAGDASASDGADNAGNDGSNVDGGAP